MMLAVLCLDRHERWCEAGAVVLIEQPLSLRWLGFRGFPGHHTQGFLGSSSAAAHRQKSNF